MDILNLFELQWGGVSVREGMMLAIGLVGAYALYAVWGLVRWQIRRWRGGASEDKRSEPELSWEEKRPKLPPIPQPITPPKGREQASAAGNVSFQTNLDVQNLRRDLSRLRDRVTSNEDELRRLRTEIARMQAEAQAVRGAVERQEASRLVPPQYAEAAAYAERGLTPAQIASRMNIAVAEAELLVALARGVDQPTSL